MVPISTLSMFLVSVYYLEVHFSRPVRLFETPWTAAHQASLSITNSNSYPSSQWCHPATSSSVVPFSSCIQSFPASRSFLHIRWPKYWSFSFSISPSNEYSGLSSFQLDWFDLLEVQESSTPQFKSIHSSALSFLYTPVLTSTRDYWKNHSFVGKVMSLLSNMLSRLVIAFLLRTSIF